MRYQTASSWCGIQQDNNEARTIQSEAWKPPSNKNRARRKKNRRTELQFRFFLLLTPAAGRKASAASRNQT